MTIFKTRVTQYLAFSCKDYLKELSPEQFKGLGITLGDMRISVGLENAEDLINDLEHALNTIS